ncbi:hypothetical protein NE237_015200 [Protea cynaroides]|uniref:Ninja-family protein n=1 Tax=Protea cynaroides TaxID=273540 RepID=A0A9Q0KDQ5_9MAGN|nr:hypothetical protein NE237_015200 [Protea cynaroides]
MTTAWEMMVEDNDIELSLGLSIGGCFGKSEKLIPIRHKSVGSAAMDEIKSGETDGDLRSTVVVSGEEKDLQRKREIHALRRQEARKKREEKQQKKRIASGRNGGYMDGNAPMKIGSMDEKMLLEAQEYQSKSGLEQICKKAKLIDEVQQDLNQMWKQSQNPNPSSAFASPAFPIVPMRYPYPNMEYFPFPNGFAFPYGVPYWAAPPPASAAVNDDKNVFQPVSCRTFLPFHAQNSNVNHNRSGSCYSEQNGSKGGRVKQMQSSLCSSSPGSSSSGVSDYQSTSHQGGCSSDTRSHSSRSASEQHQLHTTVVNNASSQLLESTQCIGEPAQKTEKLVSSINSEPNPKKPEEKPISITEPLPIHKPFTTTDNISLPPRSQPPQAPGEAKGKANKPPTPLPHQPPQTQALPHMPCVSTTGNGPNGKTITGFLYRYTKTEVTIMCGCHGSSFTPAEFVKHAGGTDVSHPLKHIIVVPPSF